MKEELWKKDNPYAEEPRPWLITLLCLFEWVYTLMGIYFLLSMPLLRKELIAMHGILHPIIVITLNLLLCCAIYGIWRMKQWGLIAYCVLYIMDIIYGYITGYEALWHYLPGLLFIIICLFYMNEMK